MHTLFYLRSDYLGKLILVTGGARSGKSSFAEELIKGYGGNAIYIATAIAFDEEMKHRINKHRKQRPSHWETVEAYKDLDALLGEKLNGKAACLLDCITIMVSNLMFEENLNWEYMNAEDLQQIEEKVRIEIEKFLNFVRGASIPFVAVTNEIGMGIVPENALARIFRDIAGRINQLLAKSADEVYLCVSGIPVKIK